MAGKHTVPVFLAVVVAGGLAVGAAGSATAQAAMPSAWHLPLAQPYPPAPDVEPPTAPLNLEIVGGDEDDDDDEEEGVLGTDQEDDEEEGDIVLAWEASTDNVGVAAYDIYASRSPFRLIASVPGNVLTYTDIQPLNVQVSYFVKARDDAGNVSRRSNIVTREGRRPHRHTVIVEGGKILHAEGAYDRGGGHREYSRSHDGPHGAPPPPPGKTLPFTGAPTVALAGLGGVMLLAGAGTVIAVRRRRSSNTA